MAAPLDHDEYRRWHEQAGRALDTASLAAAGAQFEWACFLAEQAAQLAAKGLLHALGLDAWGHDLTVLGAKLVDDFGDLVGDGFPEAVARLSRHYIATRYPDAHPSGTPGAHYTSDDGVQALEDAGVVLGAVERIWTSVGGSP